MTYLSREDPLLRYAIREIKKTYGVDVSVEAKDKQLGKFGFTENCQATTTEIQRLPSGVQEEVEIYKNLITTISSDNASDTGVVNIEGHTVGADFSTTITQTGGTATATATAHGNVSGDWVWIDGANEAGYNGLIEVETADTNTFTYSVDSGTASPATGTITSTNQNKTFVVQQVTLNGQTQVSLTTPLAKSTRLAVPKQNKATKLLGSVYVYESDTTTAGVPDTANKVHLMNGTNGDINNSLKAKTALSSEDFLILTHFHAHWQQKNAGFATVTLQKKELGGVWSTIDNIAVSDGQSTVIMPFEPYAIIPANAETRVIGGASAANSAVGGSFIGYLAKII